MELKTLAVPVNNFIFISMLARIIFNRSFIIQLLFTIFSIDGIDVAVSSCSHIYLIYGYEIYCSSCIDDTFETPRATNKQTF